MTYGQDPFEASQRDALHGTDALLDRIGARSPTPDDLDDPLVAALALMAAEIDLDGVPVEVTRAAVERALGDLGLGETRPQAAQGDGRVDERTGLVLDLRDPPVGAALGAVPAGPDPSPRRPHRGPRRPPQPAASAIAPPRSLPRASSHPAGARPQGRRRGLRPATAFVAAVAAIVLGTGVSAIVTGGRSVNPVTGFQQVVAQLTGSRTAEQSSYYNEAQRYLERARAALTRGNRADARADLAKIDVERLAPVDRDDIGRQVAQLRVRAGG